MFREQDTIALRTIREQLPDFAITSEQVSQLRAMFVGGCDFAPDFEVQCVALTNLYLDMLETFMRYHSGESDLESVRRQEVLKVARSILRFPLRPGWMRIARRLFTIDHGFPWSVLRKVSKAVGRRLGGHALNVLHVTN